MGPEAVTPTGAETPQTETISAERAAANREDVGGFLRASRERRAGKAPADVTQAKPAASTEPARRERPATAERPGAAGARPAAATVPGRDGQPASGPTDKDRQADERLATQVRRAVEDATAESTRKIRELEERLATGRQPAGADGRTAGDGAQPAANATERKGPLTAAEIKRYEAMPGAPKLDDKDASGAYVYETAHQHSVALSHFISETRTAERAAETRTTTEHVDRVKREAARVTTFGERIETFKQANPERLVDNGKGGKGVALSPDVSRLHGFGMLAQVNADRRSKGLAPVEATVDHAIAEELYDSPIPMECAVFLSDHPEELAELRKLTNPAQLARAFGALEYRVRQQSKPAGSVAATAATTAATAGSTKQKPSPADERREAESAVDRSVSSTKPLTGGNLGRPASTEKDPTETAIEKGNVGMFLEIERTKRQEQLDRRLGRAR